MCADDVRARDPELVGNHNGGLLPTDGFFTGLAIHDHFGADRAMYALAHDFLFDDPVLRKVVLGHRTGFPDARAPQRRTDRARRERRTHEQLFVLTRGDRLARILHAHWSARTEVMPIVLAIPWGITSGFVPYLPLPAQTTIAFGEPMRWPDLGPDDAERPEALERCYREPAGNGRPPRGRAPTLPRAAVRPRQRDGA